MSQGECWTPAYVGLGSNLGDPRRQVDRALAGLADAPGTRLVARSSLYASAPMGPIEQPDFINAVAGVLTQLTPRELLAELKSLELRLGREPAVVRWGPRRIDLDLLMHGFVEINEPQLRLPHPGIAERAFVLLPLAELAPHLQVPGFGRVDEMVRSVNSTGVKRLVE